MNAFQVMQRLRAWNEGTPLPRGETLHFPLAKAPDTLVLAFVRMGGESSPWGLAWGRPGQPPTIRTVPEPRERDAVAAMVAELAPVLLAHLLHPAWSDAVIGSAKDERPLRQVWLPNASHAEMLHHLAYAYTFARKGDPARVPLLNALGRAAGWLFRESKRPGQFTVMAASEALRESYTFPCEDVRQGHLGYLMAWLQTTGNRAKRLTAAATAERRSISTSLDPAVERDELAEPVERYGEARNEERAADAQRAATIVARILAKELAHRFELTAAALANLARDRRRVNRGIARLQQEAWAAHWHDYLRTERAILDRPGEPVFVRSPETDHRPSAAAEHYFTQEAHEDLRLSVLLEDDAEMLAEAVASGRAIQGVIADVRDEGTGRSIKPVWDVRVEGEAATTLRKGKTVLLAQLRGRRGRIRDIAPSPRRGFTIFTIEITGLKTVPRKQPGGGVLAATDRRLVETEVVLLPDIADGIHLRKRKQLQEQNTPGSWLTATRPTSRKARLPDEVVGTEGGPTS